MFSMPTQEQPVRDENFRTNKRLPIGDDGGYMVHK